MRIVPVEHRLEGDDPRFAVLVVVVPDDLRVLRRLALLVTRVKGIEYDLDEAEAERRLDMTVDRAYA